MTAQFPKITLSPSRDIPFNKLVLSQSNVRRIKAGVSIDELAEDIARRGLLQGLNVRPVLDAEGAETGMFEIPAGGRRYRALALLVKQKRLGKTALVPCVVRDPSDILAEDDSLAENIQRAPLHPLDQFRSFQTLREKGQSEEDIAAAFFVSPNVVKQRLRLASVSPKLLDIYAEDKMSLEQLMAFTVCDDHARQEQVWAALKGNYEPQPYQIRRMLTERTVHAEDKRAVFVGIETYEAAGGTVLRDLFDEGESGWLENVALLDELVLLKLSVEAEAVEQEGWKWIEVAPEFPYGHTRGLSRLTGIRADFNDEEGVAIEALIAEQRQLEVEYSQADELPEAVDERLGEIETALAAFEDRPLIYDRADIGRGGAFVSIDSDGTLLIDRGYIKPEDEASKLTAIEGTEGDSRPDGEGKRSTDGDPARSRIHVNSGEDEIEDQDNAVRPLPDRLLLELTAHRTLALRDALAKDPHVAMTALLHKVVGDIFERTRSVGSCLEVTVHHVFFPVQAADLKDSACAKSVNARHEAWAREIPQGEDAVWNWLDQLDQDRRLALLAHCVGYGANALYERIERYQGSGNSARRLQQAARLAGAVGLDMVKAGWRPTVDSYLGRVTKPRILEAVREARGDQAAQLIDHLKKPDMAREAERLLDGTGWLPEPLRTLDAPADEASACDDADEEALPAFLTDADPQHAGDEAADMAAE